MYFDEFELSDEVLDALDSMNFSECTPIQEQTIPVILGGRDLIACAQTGTGKTAAFLLPIINRLAEGTYPDDAINAVVISPTRELAQQIDRQMEGFSYFLPVSSVPVYGGTDGAGFVRQQKALKAGADVVIATPGRLLDHIKMGYVDLSRVSFLVLDEADRMLDMGFFDDIIRIVNLLPKNCQRLMFSATMPPKTRNLASRMLHDPVQVNIAVSRPTEKINQSCYICGEGEKTPLLRRLFTEVKSERVIVFASSKQNVKTLTSELRRAGLKAAEMHSDLDQTRRDEVMLAFRAGKIHILVATDILARGIDIDDIAMVVNYDVPREAEDYVHRIGRTARAGAEGKAVTLVSDRDRRRWAMIEKFLGYTVTRNGKEDNENGAKTDGKVNGDPARENSGKRKPRRNRNSGSRKRKDTEQTATAATDASSGMTATSAVSDAAAEKPNKNRYFHRRRRPGQKAEKTES